MINRYNQIKKGGKGQKKRVESYPTSGDLSWGCVLVRGPGELIDGHI